MRISRISPVTGVINTLWIEVTEEQLERWQEGALIQNAMPHLTDVEREFIMTGCTEKDWEQLWGVAIDGR